MKKQNTSHQRFFWRVRYRYGANWSQMTERQIARELRMVSWRHA